MMVYKNIGAFFIMTRLETRSMLINWGFVEKTMKFPYNGGSCSIKENIEYFPGYILQ